MDESFSLGRFFVIVVSLLSFRSLLNLIPELVLAHNRLSVSKSGRIKRIATKRMLATADALRLEEKCDRAEKILADVLDATDDPISKMIARNVLIDIWFIQILDKPENRDECKQFCFEHIEDTNNLIDALERLRKDPCRIPLETPGSHLIVP